jgi:hypothetical protein
MALSPEDEDDVRDREGRNERYGVMGGTTMVSSRRADRSADMEDCAGRREASIEII